MSSPYLPHRHAVPRKDRRSTPPPASRGRPRAQALLAGLPGLLRGLLGRDTLAGIAVAVLATLAMLALTQAQADAALLMTDR